ncbi:thiol:disulfide interchange protein dsbA [Candidatus Blochmanniella vafra str. BVAF]|uniref:Thiol:disulfide interchange protein n=1 Tax=Blochmanniella vafra (strain BVAF) TaxID=859654 RepID=E8Q797_BLOVB|nr:thiol:disulfide interchange protein dsbA [Candidatus Blochmannia vafer str. BVAF]
MKAIYFLLVMTFCIYLHNHASSSIIEGKQYIKLHKPIHNAPKILEFFSFYCTHCYQFEQIYNISNNIQKKLPKNIIFYKYHVNYIGDLGKQLTHAWAVAMALGIENQVSSFLFTAIQKQQSIHTIDDIRKTFIKLGIDADTYDTTWNSILVQSLIKDQEQAAINFQLKSIPAIFVDGKYMVKNDQLNIASIPIYIQQFSELLHLLIEKK